MNKPRDLISILYVDDEPANLFLFEVSFQDIFKVHSASSGEEGLKLLEKKSDEVKVVISDMRMPKMNGVEFIKSARNKYNNLIYFILTGFEFNDDIDKALEEGVILQSFTKPFDSTEIEKAILKYLNGK
jgi:response regulator RpfG family c-di-GMP phosphodiesterase